MKPHLFRWLLVALAPCVLPLHALEFRLVSWEGDISDLNYSDGNTPVPVSASEGALSTPYHFEGPGPLILYKEVPAEGKIVRQPMATLTIPPNFTAAIILLAYADPSRTTFTGTWIDDSLEARPPQTVTYRNFSSYPVAIKLGAGDYAIAPQGSLTQLTDSAVERVLFKAAAQTKSGWKAIASTVQPVRPGMRTLVILRDGRPSPGTGIKALVDMLRFNDYPPPPASVIASR